MVCNVKRRWQYEGVKSVTYITGSLEASAESGGDEKCGGEEGSC